MARPSPLDIYALLDKSNCGECGYATCMAMATDLLERKVKLEDCTHLMQQPKQAKNLAKLREITTPPQKPVIIGVGERACIVGGEEVLMRHQLTYYNETAIFMEIADDNPDLEEIIKYLTDLKIERMGDVLRINGIALRCVSGDIDQFKLAAKKISELTDLPIMLCCITNPEILLAGATEIKDKKPLLYGATKDSWEQVGTFAVQNNLPIAAISSDLDELISLSATLQKLGAKEIVLDPGTFFGPGKLAFTYDNILQLRNAAIDKEDPNAGWPVMGVPAAYWVQIDTSQGDLWTHQYQEIIMGAIMESIDTSLIVLSTGKKKDDIWALLALMTLRQSIFSDPRIYPTADPGLIQIGEPGDMAPIFVTSNYRLTKIPVEIDIKGANLDSWLLVVNSEGIGIESAVAGGQFNATAIAEAVQEFKAFDNVKHRILIIPGMAARLSGALEDEADAVVLVGPRDSSGIKKFYDTRWDPEKDMKEYAER